MGKIVTMVLSEIRMFLRDKAAVFWVILWPIIIILMAAYIFVPPGAGSPIILDVGVVNHDTSNTPLNGTLLVKILNESEYNGTRLFNVKMYDNETMLEEDLRHGLLDAGIIIPEDFGENATYSQARLTLLIGAKDMYSASIAEGVLKGFLSEFSQRTGLTKAEIMIQYMSPYISENQTVTAPAGNVSLKEFLESYFKGIATPINISTRSVKPPAYTTRERLIGWMTIGGIGMMFLYTGFYIGASMLVIEKERGTLRRLIASPLRENEFIIAKTVSGILEMLISAVIALLVGIYLAGAYIVFDPLNPLHWLAVAMLFVSGLMTIGFGSILALFAKTSSGASGLGTSLGLILSFIAGIWLPTTMLPSWLRLLASIFPVTWSINTVRDILVYGKPWSMIYMETLGSIAATIAVFIVAWFIFKMLLRKYVEA